MAIKSKPAAERVSYGGPGTVAQPPRLTWKTDGIYTCPELRHRSQGDNHPSLISGRRVYR